jgi:hypothetical protein
VGFPFLDISHKWNPTCFWSSSAWSLVSTHVSVLHSVLWPNNAPS